MIIKRLFKKPSAFFLIFLTLLFMLPSSVLADWQSILSQQFDIVETFDDLQDWTGLGYGDVTDLATMPIQTTGEKSIWNYYSHWGADTSKTWIGNHGENNIWRGTGKSLRIDYNTSNGSLGPSRLGLTIGSSPSDGYPSEAYTFYFSRYDVNFFPRDGDKFLPYGYLKTFEFGTGFRSAFDWGTVAEQLAAVNFPQERNVYGLNYNVLNIGVTPTYDLRIDFNPRYATTSDNGDTKVLQSFYGTTSLVDDPIRTSSWFAVEHRYKMSNPAGSPTGEIEVWIYDSGGNVISHELRTGVITFSDASMDYNHSINKFVLGGNRDGFTTSCSDFMFIDDFIVNGSRIGPKYFELLSSQDQAGTPSSSDPVNILPPTGLRLVNN